MHAFDRDFDFMEPEPTSRPDPADYEDAAYEWARDTACEWEADQ